MLIDLVWRYFLSPKLIRGAWMTLLITLCLLLYSMMSGLVLTLLQEAPFCAEKEPAFFYLWLFHGTPMLFQMISVYNVLPGFGLRFSTFTYTMLALSFNEGAYMAEILRPGLRVVKSGQYTVGMAPGMTHGQVMRKIILPQAVHIVPPPMGNQMVSVLKLSALASVIAVQELLLVASQAISASFRYFGALCTASIYYLLLTSLFMIFQS